MTSLLSYWGPGANLDRRWKDLLVLGPKSAPHCQHGLERTCGETWFAHWWNGVAPPPLAWWPGQSKTPGRPCWANSSTKRPPWPFVPSGQVRLHGPDLRQARGEDGRRGVLPAPLPAPAGVLPDLPRQLHGRGPSGRLRAPAGAAPHPTQLRGRLPAAGGVALGGLGCWVLPVSLDHVAANSWEGRAHSPGSPGCDPVTPLPDRAGREGRPATHRRPGGRGSRPHHARAHGHPARAQQIPNRGA